MLNSLHGSSVEITRERQRIGTCMRTVLLAMSLTWVQSASAQDIQRENYRPRATIPPRQTPLSGGVPSSAGQSIRTAPSQSGYPARRAPAPPATRATQPNTSNYPRRVGAPTAPARPSYPTTQTAPAPATGGGEQAVDLSKLNAEGSAPVGSPTGGPSGPPSGFGGGKYGGASSSAPNFKLYFDFWYINRPGVTQSTFDTWHNVFMFEVNPSPRLSFSGEISTSPRFFETSYQFTDKIQVRWGKIWVPFDDLIGPHNIFGGRINTSKFFQGSSPSQAFLPNVWADLGIAMKYQWVDTYRLAVESQAYVINGIPDGGGADPLSTVGAGASNPYPDFGDQGIEADNNSNKAIGGRVHAKFFQRVGVGTSFYHGRYTADSAEAQSITMLGFDSQLKLTSTTDIRAGTVMMKVGLNAPATKSSFSRGGNYVEAGHRFGRGRRWKILGRMGMVQGDSRIIDVNDKNIVGGAILYRIGPMELSLQYSRDLKRVPQKVNYSFTALRIVTAF